MSNYAGEKMHKPNSERANFSPQPCSDGPIHRSLSKIRRSLSREGASFRFECQNFLWSLDLRYCKKSSKAYIYSLQPSTTCTYLFLYMFIGLFTSPCNLESNRTSMKFERGCTAVFLRNASLMAWAVPGCSRFFLSWDNQRTRTYIGTSPCNKTVQCCSVCEYHIVT